MPVADSRPIVLLTHEYTPFLGGAATYVREIAAAATRNGCAVVVWAPDRGAACADAEAFPVVRLRCSGRLGISILGMAWELFKRRGELAARPVILLSAGAHMAWAILHAVGALPTGEVTAFFHGSELLKFRHAPWKTVMRRLYAAVKGYAFASQFVGGLVRESSLVDPAKPVSLAPCAAPSELQELAAWDDKAQSRDDRLVVLTVARLHPRKGQLELAAALGLLSAELRAQLVYRMVGVGAEAYCEKVEATARAAGVACEFTGALDVAGLAESYRTCHVYAQSSRTLPDSVEGFGISYIEAAAFGKPSVACDTGGVGEAVLNGVTGITVPEGDSSALADAISKLLTDPALRARMGDAGRRHAESFRWEESAAALCNFARRL